MNDEPKKYIIEAGDGTHEWDSDYAGNVSLTAAEALNSIAFFEERAKSDPLDCDDCEDGISWAGWSFRIIADDDGCYCVQVNECSLRAQTG